MISYFSLGQGLQLSGRMCALHAEDPRFNLSFWAGWAPCLIVCCCVHINWTGFIQISTSLLYCLDLSDSLMYTSTSENPECASVFCVDELQRNMHVSRKSIPLWILHHACYSVMAKRLGLVSSVGLRNCPIHAKISTCATGLPLLFLHVFCSPPQICSWDLGGKPEQV